MSGPVSWELALFVIGAILTAVTMTAVILSKLSELRDNLRAFITAEVTKLSERIETVEREASDDRHAIRTEIHQMQLAAKDRDSTFMTALNQLRDWVNTEFLSKRSAIQILQDHQGENRNHFQSVEALLRRLEARFMGDRQPRAPPSGEG